MDHWRLVWTNDGAVCLEGFRRYETCETVVNMYIRTLIVVIDSHSVAGDGSRDFSRVH